MSSSSNDRVLRMPLHPQGLALIELAILLPVLFMLLLGFLEVGRALYQQNMLTKAVVTGSRYLAREPAAVTPACAAGPQWVAASLVARQLMVQELGEAAPRLPGLDAPAAIDISVSGRSQAGVTACVISVAAQVPFVGLFGPSLVPFLDVGPLQLNAATEERYIGE